MAKDEQFRLKQQEMSDKKLAELARNEVSKLCKTGGKSLTMCVPPMITDTDMILCEVIRRFESMGEIATEYASFCVLRDRQGLPEVSYDNWLKERNRNEEV